MEGRRAGGNCCCCNYGHGGKGVGSAGHGRGHNQRDQSYRGGQYHRGGGGGGRGLGMHHGVGGYDNRPSVPAVAAGGRGGGRGRGTHHRGGDYLTGLPYRRLLLLLVLLVLVLVRDPQQEEVLGLLDCGIDRLLLHLLRQLVNSFGCESPPLSDGGDCSPQKCPQNADNLLPE